MYVFLKNKMEISRKNTLSADFCEDQIDVTTDFAVITNVIIKRVHCSLIRDFWIVGQTQNATEDPDQTA